MVKEIKFAYIQEKDSLLHIYAHKNRPKEITRTFYTNIKITIEDGIMVFSGYETEVENNLCEICSEEEEAVIYSNREDCPFIDSQIIEDHYTTGFFNKTSHVRYLVKDVFGIHKKRTFLKKTTSSFCIHE